MRALRPEAAEMIIWAAQHFITDKDGISSSGLCTVGMPARRDPDPPLHFV